MKTFHSPGELLTLTAPAYGVVSDGAYLIGDLVVIAAETVAEGSPFQGAVKGVFNLPKLYQEDWAEGDKVYFDETAGVFTTEAGSPPNVLVGVAVRVVPLSVLIESASDPADIEISGDTIVVVDYADLADAVITLTINGGTPIVLTEGAYLDYVAETSNAVTAANLAAALAALPGVSSVHTLALASNDADMVVDGLTITIEDYAAIAGKTITVTINGVAHVLTEGVDFVDDTGNNETATSLASAIDDLDGVEASAADAVVTVVLTAVQVVSDDPMILGRVRLDGVAR